MKAEIKEFQFHNGLIRTNNTREQQGDNRRFQFHNGLIRTIQISYQWSGRK